MHDDQSRSRGQGDAGQRSETGASPVISSDGVDAARAYVAPTELRPLAKGQVDAPKVKVSDPRRSATVKISRVQADAMRKSAEERPGISTPMERPAGAFQPVAVDPALAQEWAARRGQASGKDAAITQKIPKPERAAPAPAGSGAPGTEPLRAMAEGEIVDEKEAQAEERRRAEEAAKALKESARASSRAVWIPVAVTVFVGVAIALFVIKYFLLPPAVSTRSTGSSESPVVSVLVVPAPPVSSPAVAASSSADIQAAGEGDAQAPIEITLDEPDAGVAPPLLGRPWGSSRPLGSAKVGSSGTATAPPPPPPTTTSTGVIF